MSKPAQCPKCGNTGVMELNCLERYRQRHGGTENVLNSSYVCRRTDAHKHYYCVGNYKKIDGKFVRKYCCGHRWTK